jgi:uncharacterized membrane protein YhaH (DUF805 family)
LFFVLQSSSFAGLSYLLVPLMSWVMLALLAKRFHDIDKPGSWSLLIFLPIVNLFTLITLFFIRGTPETNQYGPAA